MTHYSVLLESGWRADCKGKRIESALRDLARSRPELVSVMTSAFITYRNGISTYGFRSTDGSRKTLDFYNIDNRVDIGYAKEYMQGVFNMLQVAEPDNYVMGSGKTRSIRTCINTALEFLGYKNTNPVEEFINRDQSSVSSVDSTYLEANNKKSKNAFGWDPMYRAENVVRLILEHRLNIGACADYAKHTIRGPI